MNVGGLFSGIGGWELGLQRAGFDISWHCEADPYARAILERHWPGVPCYPDVRELTGADVAPVDVLAGGFPCQDLSLAGKGAGLDGSRSGLWSEYARLIGELRPRYVVVENVAALLGRGLGRVLGDLAALGYDAEWDCIPASALGAPHQRDRVWLVAYPGSAGAGMEAHHGRGQGRQPAGSRESALLPGRHRPSGAEGPAAGGRDVPDAPRTGCHGRARRDAQPDVGSERTGGPDADRRGEGDHAGQQPYRQLPDSYGLAPFGPPVAWRERGPWRTEPDVGRVADGVPARMDRLRCLGNALVPQIAELIGRRILDYEGSCVTA